MSARGALLLVAGLFVVAIGLAGWRLGWDGLWASPDQRGRFLFERGHHAAAADAFLDPMWRGVAQMRAGDFEAAASTFAAIDTAEAAFDQGNALVMRGKYTDAVARYGRALALWPGWRAAEGNRAIAVARAARLDAKGEDAGDQREGADEVVYDKDARTPDGQETQTDGAPMSDEAVRSLWLKRVQTRPADFLRARFAYQLDAAPSAGPNQGAESTGTQQ